MLQKISLAFPFALAASAAGAGPGSPQLRATGEHNEFGRKDGEAMKSGAKHASWL